MMKRLIIHPQDASTVFLKKVYERLNDVTLIESGIEHIRNLTGLIEAHDQVIFLGHGMPLGLLSVGQFGFHTFVMNGSRVGPLKEKDNSIFIWCYASDFVRSHQLRGFATGMFISEEIEAYANGVECTEADIEISNDVFATAVGTALEQGMSNEELYAYVKQQYEPLVEINPVARYNWGRVGICGL
jgi:hypothetical protein